METLSEALPIIIYFLLIILLVVVIIFGIKLIITMSKLELLVDDVTKKVSSLDKLFNVFNLVTNRFSVITDTALSFLTSITKKLFGSKNKDEEDEEDE